MNDNISPAYFNVSADTRQEKKTIRGVRIKKWYLELHEFWDNAKKQLISVWIFTFNRLCGHAEYLYNEYNVVIAVRLLTASIFQSRLLTFMTYGFR